MPDDLLMENLGRIIDSIELIATRFTEIAKADDFVLGTNGVLLLDSTCMRLQVIGELLKKINRLNPSLFDEYPQIEWPNIMKLRDIISHHYENVDHEIVYDICKNHIPSLKRVVQQIIKDQSL